MRRRSTTDARVQGAHADDQDGHFCRWASACRWAVGGRASRDVTRDVPRAPGQLYVAGTLDYIFLTPEHLRVRAVLDLPFEDDGRHLATPLDVQFPAIPDANFPSDHLAVGCVLELVDPLGAR